MSLFFTSDIFPAWPLITFTHAFFSLSCLWTLFKTKRSILEKLGPLGQNYGAVHILNLLFKEEWNNDGMKNLLKVQIALRRQVKYYLV